MNLTKEQIAELKKKHGEIFEISVEGKSCIVRRPNRKDLSYVSVVKDPIKMSETLLKQLWVEGDKEIQEHFFRVKKQRTITRPHTMKKCP